jgi:hypothetical protein
MVTRQVFRVGSRQAVRRFLFMLCSFNFADKTVLGLLASRLFLLFPRPQRAWSSRHHEFALPQQRPAILAIVKAIATCGVIAQSVMTHG